MKSEMAIKAVPNLLYGGADFSVSGVAELANSVCGEELQNCPVPFVEFPLNARLSICDRGLRWFHTLRHHHASQLWLRLWTSIRKRLQLNAISASDLFELRRSAVLALPKTITELATLKLDDRRRLLAERKHSTAPQTGEFCFLNLFADLGSPIDWATPRLLTLPRLWRFQFQYMEWLLDIALNVEKTSGETSNPLWKIVLQWIEAHPPHGTPFSVDAWHPFCISRRIPVWLTLLAIFPPAAKQLPLIQESLLQQAETLFRNLETDLGGNHLLENARALAMAGVSFTGRRTEQWLKRSCDILQHELHDQILQHGEHFERSPMYHCQMIEALRDVSLATADCVPEISALCRSACQRMTTFLTAILHPDGAIPLLSDSGFGEAVIPHPLPAISNSKEPEGNRVESYWTCRCDEDFLLFDAGPIGADHLPAHAHADLLTIEASLNGRRVLVDSGTFNYEADEMRQYCRSTAAHNVLEIDGQNQCDVWSRFRMGRRGRPSPLVSGTMNQWEWAAAVHDAYAFRGVSQVGRWVGCHVERQWVILDWARGRGRHQLVNRLHLHPGMAGKLVDHQFKLELGADSFWITALGNGTLRLAAGWYCPEFGIRQRSLVLEWETQCEAPAACGWIIGPEPPPVPPRLILDERRQILSLHGGPTADNLWNLNIPLNRWRI